jgi:hypothetical protein
MSRREKVPVTTRAVIQRINRELKPDLQMLKITRGERWRPELGDFYVSDFNKNWIVEKHVDPETLGRELEVLESWEKVVDELGAAS